MEFIAHRINTIKELKAIPKNVGVEIDIRDNEQGLYLSHDPFLKGDTLEDFLKFYQHGTLILNIKSERIEYAIIELLKKYKIEKYFFLDSSIPMIHSLNKINEKNIALRFSEYECIETVLKMKNMAKWVWVDCFTELPINKDNYKILKNSGLKLCLVSPELQNQPDKILPYWNYLKENEIIFDAICSKINNYNIFYP